MKRPSWRVYLRRALIAGLGSIAVLFLAASGLQLISTWRFERQHPPPGELVDIGGYRLHIHRQGQGDLPIVLDAGLTGASYDWGVIAPEIARFAEVWTYDRAGNGWSDNGPRPRTSQQAVQELRALLHRSNVRRPFVLVGYSWAGLNARLYASLYPDEVAALVLVDALNFDLKDVNSRGGMPPLYTWFNRFAFLGTGWLVLPGMIPKATNETQAQLRKLRLGMQCRTKTVHTIYDELRGQSNWRTVRALMKHLEDKPVLILSRRIEKDDPAPEQAWLEAQYAQTNISTRTKLLFSKSKSHGFPEAEPDFVVQAIRELVRSIQEAN